MVFETRDLKDGGAPLDWRRVMASRNLSAQEESGSAWARPLCRSRMRANLLYITVHALFYSLDSSPVVASLLAASDVNRTENKCCGKAACSEVSAPWTNISCACPNALSRAPILSSHFRSIPKSARGLLGAKNSAFVHRSLAASSIGAAVPW